MYNLRITAELSPDHQKEAVTGYIKVVGIEDALKEYTPPIRETLELSIE